MAYLDSVLSTDLLFKSFNLQYSSVASWVAASTTEGATPASNASCQRLAQRHHLSPGCSPGKPKSGLGLLRSLPRCLEKSRNSFETTAQTLCTPRSSGPVL